MKCRISASVLFLLLLFTASAGCIGDQTTDLRLGNASIGTVTITPVYDQLFTNASLSEKVNIRLEVFGLVFTKNGVTRAEAEDIRSNVTTPDGGLNLDFINSSGLLQGNPDDSARNLEEFMDSVFHMPLTNRNPGQTVADIDWGNAMSRMQDSLNRTLELANF
jgi:hypothetical protein